MSESTTATRFAPPMPPPPPMRPRNGAPVATMPTAPAAVRRVTVRAVKSFAPKLIFSAVEGWGKTTIGASAPDPIILMSRGETGYDTLLTTGRVPAVPAETVETWADLLGWCDSLIADPQGRKALVLDALSGFERLCHEHICKTVFSGDWGEHGFLSFHKGYDLAAGEWLNLIAKLERLNTEHGMTIIILSHVKVSKFQNPLGSDFDRYSADCHAKTWGPTAKWSDAILFGNYHTIIQESKGKKAKGIGGTERVLFTERCDAWDAKNRFGMPSEISLRDVAPADMWATIWAYIRPEQAALAETAATTTEATA